MLLGSSRDNQVVLRESYFCIPSDCVACVARHLRRLVLRRCAARTRSQALSFLCSSSCLCNAWLSATLVEMVTWLFSSCQCDQSIDPCHCRASTQTTEFLHSRIQAARHPLPASHAANGKCDKVVVKHSCTTYSSTKGNVFWRHIGRNEFTWNSIASKVSHSKQTTDGKHSERTDRKLNNRQSLTVWRTHYLPTLTVKS